MPQDDELCRRGDLDVIAKLEAGFPLADLHSLLPEAWAGHQAAQQAASDVTAHAT